MALRTIVKDGDPILKKVCRPVTKFDDRLATLLDDMHADSRDRTVGWGKQFFNFGNFLFVHIECSFISNFVS